MAKYTDSPPVPTWYQRIANETAETNRLLRKYFVLTGNNSRTDPTTQDDDGGF